MKMKSKDEKYITFELNEKLRIFIIENENLHLKDEESVFYDENARSEFFYEVHKIHEGKDETYYIVLDDGGFFSLWHKDNEPPLFKSENLTVLDFDNFFSYLYKIMNPIGS